MKNIQMFLFVIITCFAAVNCTIADFGPIKALFTSVTDPSRRACPLCDSSVYSYCGDKLFHDSCCCYVPKNPYDQLPRQCQYEDCRYLNAESCIEHELITACCCTSYLRR